MYINRAFTVNAFFKNLKISTFELICGPHNYIKRKSFHLYEKQNKKSQLRIIITLYMTKYQRQRLSTKIYFSLYWPYTPKKCVLELNLILI